MKRLLTLGLSLLLTLGASAQINFGEAVNTLKDRITVSGYAQGGFEYNHRYGSENEFTFNRAVLTVQGQITDRWYAVLSANLKGGTVLEYYTDYTVAPFLKARIGQFKNPYTFENQISTADIDLIHGGSLAMRYLAATDGTDIMNSASSGRDLGFMVHGDFLYGLFNYAVAVMNGQGMNKSDGNNQKDIIARLNFKLGDNFALGGSYLKGKGHALANNYALGIAQGENYRRDRWAFGGKYKSRLFDLSSEVLGGKDKDSYSKGFYASSRVHFTPKLDLILSYDYFNTNEFDKYDAKAEGAPKVSPNELQNQLFNEIQSNYVAGLQYWFYPKCRVQVQYVFNDCHIAKNASSILAQVQVAF